MSWQIPNQIEQDIISGKATYRTFQTGVGGQSILPVPANSYVVIFGYDFSPAGGGVYATKNVVQSGGPVLNLTDASIALFETQQISFYTGSDFYPFIHHCEVNTELIPYLINAADPANELVAQTLLVTEIDASPIARQVYITATNDVTITHGLVINATRASANAIPVTNRTPQGLTYGGSGQVVNTQTNFGPNATPLQFMQPSTKDYQDFSFGLLPSNADGQAFATPDTTNGLRDSSSYFNAYGPNFVNKAGVHYYLCLHYALYQKPISSKQG